MNHKLAKLGFSFALVAILALGLTATTSEPAGAAFCPNTTCGAGSHTYQYGGCDVDLGHCIGFNCSVLRNNATGQLCLSGCNWA